MSKEIDGRVANRLKVRFFVLLLYRSDELSVFIFGDLAELLVEGVFRNSLLLLVFSHLSHQFTGSRSATETLEIRIHSMQMTLTYRLPCCVVLKLWV